MIDPSRTGPFIMWMGFTACIAAACYRRGLARGRFEMTEAHVAAKMVDYGMAVYPDGRGCPVCRGMGRV